MATVDTGIYSALLKPPKSVGDFDREARAAEAEEQALAGGRLKMEDAARARARAAGLDALMRDTAGASDLDRLAALSRGGYLGEAADLRKSLTDAEKGRADAGKTSAETKAKQFETAEKAWQSNIQAISSFRTPDDVKQHLANIVTAAPAELQPQHLERARQMISSIPADLGQFEGWRQQQLEGLMTAGDQMKFRLPDANARLSSDTQRRNADVAAATSRENNRNTVAATRYGIDQRTALGREGIAATNSRAAAKAKPAGPIKLSSTLEKELIEADDVVNTSRTSADSLKRALELNEKAFDGPLASKRAGALLLIRPNDPAALATQQFENIVLSDALGSMKSIFGGNPTEGERQILLDLQAAPSKPRTARAAILKRAQEAATRRAGLAKQRSQAIRSGTYTSQNPVDEAAAGIDDLVNKYDTED